MRHVEINAVIDGETAEGVFEALLGWELPDPGSGSSWDWGAGEPAVTRVTSGVRPRWLDFPTGTLRWDEEIRSERELLQITFHQVDGDFASFSGKWSLRQRGTGAVELRYEVDYDFGVTSMDGLLDPIAEHSVRDVIRRAINGMVQHVRWIDPTETARPTAATAAKGPAA